MTTLVRTPGALAVLPRVLVALATLALGCSAEPRTEVLVVIDAEPEVRAMASHLELRVLGASRSAEDWREVRVQTIGSPVVWPRSIGLVPTDGDARRRFDVRASARQGADGPVVARVRVLSSYLAGQTLELRLLLEDACIGQRCDEEQTCRAGSCVEPEVVDPRTLGPPGRLRVDGGSGGEDAAAADAGLRSCPDDMIRIPAVGDTVTFTMGSAAGDAHAGANERPETVVTLNAFCLDRTEVTVGQYAACVNADECVAAPGSADFCGRACNGNRGDRRDHPVNCVDWSMADAFCRWRGGRLPTEAEWELAARGPEGRTYPWGEAPPTAELLNAYGAEAVSEIESACGVSYRPLYTPGDGYAFTAPVGSYPAGGGPYGHLDLAGNAWEWVADYYVDRYPGGSTTNPRVTESTGFRVVRGGGWDSQVAGLVRGATRGSETPPLFRDSLMGFRCAGGEPSTSPPPGSIVINELDYDQVGPDNAELIELYNTTTAPIDLEGLSLYLFDCSIADAPRRYSPIPIALSGMIAAHGYGIIASAGVGPAFSATVVRVDVPGMVLQNGGARAGEPGDGVALIHRSTGTAIDVVAYENRCAWTRIAGRDIALTEGTPTVAADSNDMNGSLSRMPNGTDTADNERDFAFTATATPGEANR